MKPDPDMPTDWESHLLEGREGYKAAMVNIVLILRSRAEWHGVLGYCEFSYRRMKRLPTPSGSTGEWTTIDTLELRDWLGHHYDMTPTNNEVEDAVFMVSMDNKFHPIREYLQGLEWDQAPRLATWLKESVGAVGTTDKDKEYLGAVGTKFLIGAVARVMRQPIKMDNVLILEGNQGKGKSTLVRILFGVDWYSETGIDIGNKDAFQQVQGKWGIELPELDSLNKAESSAAKSFISPLKDRFRPPYGRNVEEFARQCVFVGTTNQDEYLKDYSGNRRFWPIRCAKIDIQAIERDRDQLWAEAVHLFDSGTPWWVDSDTDESELFKQHQDERMLDDPWESLIGDYLDSKENKSREHFTAAEILIHACKRDAGHIQRADQHRISPLMKHLGWTSSRKRVDVEGKVKQTRVYVRPKSSPETF